MTNAANSLSHRILDDLSGTLRPPGRAWWLWMAGAGVVAVTGVGAYLHQLRHGLAVTGLRDDVAWGVYLANFVFFIGMSYAGTLISAILRLTHAEWRRPITRMAEALTFIPLLVGAAMVVVDMGRPDRLLNVLIHGRLSSPIVWDVLSIMTYLAGSLLYLYTALIPDLALLAGAAPDGQAASLRCRLYRFLSLGYRGTPEQRRLLDRALAIMAVIIIPVAVSAHTVVSWIFGMTLRPGWHSGIFGPYFVVAAVLSGTALLLTAMAVFRRAYGLEGYLTHRQFRNLGWLLLALTLLYLYFTLSEYMTLWYGGVSVDQRLVGLLLGKGAYGMAFWGMTAMGLVLPVLLLAIPTRTSIAPVVVASVLINVGLWIKRYLIVVPTQLTTFIPPEAEGIRYTPTWVEWAITAGGLASVILLLALFSKVFPIVSIWETTEGVESAGAEQVGIDLIA
jgi:Ni/Fe-hydrogenase subunit HybB-like protein